MIVRAEVTVKCEMTDKGETHYSFIYFYYFLAMLHSLWDVSSQGHPSASPRGGQWGPQSPPGAPQTVVVSLGMKASVPAEEHPRGPSLHLTPGFSELPPERGFLPARVQVERAPGLPQRPFLE